MGQVEFRGVPNTALGTAMKAQAMAILGLLHLGPLSGTIFLYWQGGDSFESWLLSYKPAPGSPTVATVAVAAVTGMLDLVVDAFKVAGIPFTVDR